MAGFGCSMGSNHPLFMSKRSDCPSTDQLTYPLTHHAGYSTNCGSLSVNVKCYGFLRRFPSLQSFFSLFSLVFNIILPLLLRSSRGGSDQRCRQSMTLSGLNLSPWSSPANSPLRLSPRLLHKNHRIPLSPPTPCGSVSTSKQNSKKFSPKIISG